MSVLKDTLALLTDNPARKYDLGGLVHALELENAATLSVALSDLVKRGDVRREKKSQGPGSWYFVGSRAEPPTAGVTAPSGAPAGVGKPARKAPGKPRAAPRHKAAGVEKTAQPDGVPAALAIVEAASNGEADDAALFAIRSDGRLGISCGTAAEKAAGVSLSAVDVRRLQVFLMATATLWSA